MPIEAKPNWPLELNLPKERAIQVATRIHSEGFTWRQSIAMALIDNANRCIEMQNGQVHLDIQDPQYMALFGYRAAMEAILQREGFETNPHSIFGHIKDELIEDMRPNGHPATVNHSYSAGGSWQETVADGLNSGELIEDVFKDNFHVTGVRAATHVALEYHLQAAGVQNTDELTGKGLIYMFGKYHPNYIGELSSVLPKPTLLGRIQAVRDHTNLAREIEKLHPQAA